MTGVEFSLYVKAKLNRIDTSSWEDVRTEEILFFATEALKKLSVRFDTGMTPPIIDEHTRQAYLASITKIVEIDLRNNEQILPLLIKIKDVYVYVLCGDFTDWTDSVDVVLSTPIANAGLDREIQLPTRTIILDGSLSSDQFSPITYNWVVSAGSLSNNTAIKPTWTFPDSPGVYTAVLTVTNAVGTSDFDYMILTVVPIPVYYNTERSQSFAKNDCQDAFYNSEASQTFQKNDCESSREYSNTEKSGTATKECVQDGKGGDGSVETYVVPAGSYTSNTSQEEADARAQEDVDENKQAYANSEGVCTSTYANSEQSGTATKNNCESGEGSTETYVVPNGTYTSTVSKADADSQANDDVDANKQAYANSYGTCTVTYTNAERSQTFTKNDC
jgi:hypothetical protein